MSGYPALRPSENEYPRNSAQESPAWHEEQSDSPIVLARVADFSSEPHTAYNEPLEASLVEPLDDDPADCQPRVLDVVHAARSRLALGGLFLVAGLFGFFLGRFTSPTPTLETDAYNPAPSASEAPSWNSESLTVSEGPLAEPTAPNHNPSKPPRWETSTAASPATPTKTSEPTWPKTPAPSTVTAADQSKQQAPISQNDMPVNHTPWPRQVDRPSNMGSQSQWAANGRMSLPGTQATAQPNRRPIENAPREDERLARRPTLPASMNTRPREYSPPMPKQYPGGQTWPAERSQGPLHGGPTNHSTGMPNQNGTYTNQGAWGTPYPPRSGPETNVNNQGPVQRTPGYNPPRYTD